MRLIALLLFFSLQAYAQDTTQHIIAGRTNAPKQQEKPYVILMSADGFRSDFSHKYEAKFLQSKGVRVIPIHPRGEDVLGERTYTSLAAAVEDHPDIDVVDCFVASQRVGRVMQEAIDLKLPALWLQLEIVDEEMAAQATAQGIKVVMDRCPAIEWPRLHIA